MRHYCRARDADADVEHSGICDDAWIGNKPEQDTDRAGFGKDQFGGKTTSDSGDEGDDNGLNVTKTFGLQIQHQEHIRSRDDATPHQRNPKEKLQPDG